MKRVAVTVAVILATLTVAALLWRFRDAAILFLFSLALGATVRPPINRLVERGWPRGLAMAATYLVSLGIFLGLLYFAGGPLFGELQRAGDSFAGAYERFTAQPPETGALRLLATRLPRVSDLYAALSSAQGVTLVNNALGFTLSLFDLLSKAVIILVLSIYWVADQVHFERLWLSLLPAEHRGRARNIWRAIEVGVGAYVRSELIQSVLAGILLGLGFWALGLPYPVLLALIGAVAWLIPLLGGPLALVAVGLIASLQGVGLAAVATVYTLVVFLVLEFVIERLLFVGRHYSSILMVLVMIALGSVLGLFGLLAAPPLAAAIQIFFRELLTQPTASVAVPGRAVSQVTQLRERLQAARTLAERMEEPPPPEMVSLVNRLSHLIDEVADVAGDWPGETSTGFARLMAVQAGGQVEAK